MKSILLSLLLCTPLFPSFEQCSRQVQESIRERKVTVKIVEDRIRCVERRAATIENILHGIVTPPDDIVDQLDQLKHDKRSLVFVLKSMKEEE
jgi:hypothetical protein